MFYHGGLPRRKVETETQATEDVAQPTDSQLLVRVSKFWPKFFYLLTLSSQKLAQFHCKGMIFLGISSPFPHCSRASLSLHPCTHPEQECKGNLRQLFPQLSSLQAPIFWSESKCKGELAGPSPYSCTPVRTKGGQCHDGPLWCQNYFELNAMKTQKVKKKKQKTPIRFRKSSLCPLQLLACSRQRGINRNSFFKKLFFI